jgi:hypothetical protein
VAYEAGFLAVGHFAHRYAMRVWMMTRHTRERTRQNRAHACKHFRIIETMFGHH